MIYHIINWLQQKQRVLRLSSLKRGSYFSHLVYSVLKCSWTWSGIRDGYQSPSVTTLPKNIQSTSRDRSFTIILSSTRSTEALWEISAERSVCTVGGNRRIGQRAESSYIHNSYIHLSLSHSSFSLACTHFVQWILPTPKTLHKLLLRREDM